LAAADRPDLSTTLQRLAPRWFVIRNAQAKSPPLLMQPRFAISLMRGPMTRMEIQAARGVAGVVTVGDWVGDSLPSEEKAS
jgi:hypothetical protein